MKKSLLSLAIISSALLVGCQSTGTSHEASTYSADQLNTKTAAKTIEIIAIMPAKVEIDNSENKELSTKAGGLFGAITGAVIGSTSDSNRALVGGVAGGATGAVAGSMVSSKKIVEGVSLTYSENNEIFTSVQAGQMCQFKNGTALVVMTKENETRIQPNATCPVEE